MATAELGHDQYVKTYLENVDRALRGPEYDTSLKASSDDAVNLRLKSILECIQEGLRSHPHEFRQLGCSIELWDQAYRHAEHLDGGMGSLETKILRVFLYGKPLTVYGWNDYPELPMLDDVPWRIYWEWNCSRNVHFTSEVLLHVLQLKLLECKESNVSTDFQGWNARMVLIIDQMLHNIENTTKTFRRYWKADELRNMRTAQKSSNSQVLCDCDDADFNLICHLFSLTHKAQTTNRKQVDLSVVGTDPPLNGTAGSSMSGFRSLKSTQLRAQANVRQMSTPADSGKQSIFELSGELLLGLDMDTYRLRYCDEDDDAISTTAYASGDEMDVDFWSSQRKRCSTASVYSNNL